MRNFIGSGAVYGQTSLANEVHKQYEYDFHVLVQKGSRRRVYRFAMLNNVLLEILSFLSIVPFNIFEIKNYYFVLFLMSPQKSTPYLFKQLLLKIFQVSHDVLPFLQFHLFQFPCVIITTYFLNTPNTPYRKL